MYGDFRYRQETINEESTEGVRNRQRLRLRVGFDAKVSKRIKVLGRLASGSDSEATSANQSADDAFSSKDFLD